MEEIKLKKRGLKIIKKSNILIDEKNQILKRLEIIKSSIAIEDEEVIELQVMKLSKMQIDDDVKTIILNLENLDYSSAVVGIESYLKRYSGVAKYIDTEAQGLKLELKTLELKFQELVEQKTEYLNDIEEFNREYNLHLGELIKDILNLKKEILYKKTIKQQKKKEKYQEDIQTFQNTKETIDELKSTISELEDALDSIDEDDENYKEISRGCNELKDELDKLESELALQEEELEKTKEYIENETIKQVNEDVHNQYKEFVSEYENIKQSFYNFIPLNDDDKKEIQTLYMRGLVLSQLYPVPDKLNGKLDLVVNTLKVRCSKKDIAEVSNILDSFEEYFKSENSIENIKDIEVLKQRIEQYKQNIEAVKSEIEDIKEDETYQTISEIYNCDEYFEDLRSDLEVEKRILSDEQKNLKIELGLVQTLTPHQNEVYAQIIEKIENIFNHDNNDDNIISISGSAGVGKTFLIIKIIEHLNEKNIALVVTTPTHKALSVITDSLHKYDINNSTFAHKT
ncbi:AAA family ATPase [Aliarcobacter cryaerophilus]|uniref:AAA family ATPase n=1 Tax=Aliarcobacter cryaerophilus TaxID=28198 RepID=UPI003DA56328